MKVAAVISEYNPFHNGHLYQLKTIRSQLHADYIIIIMSGDFVQRGTPALVNKYERCRMALENGADLVFELPTYFALGSAEYFAQGAVSLADKLGVVDFLHFGSESGDIEALMNCARIIADESDAYKVSLNLHLKSGNSFPAARSLSIREQLQKSGLPCTDNSPDDIEMLLASPNNTLGIEYIKAILQRKSSIQPVTVERKGEGYNSGALASDSFISANAIRTALKNTNLSPNELSSLKQYLPESICTLLFHDLKERDCFLFPNDFSEILAYKLHEAAANKAAFAEYYDVGSQLSNTIYNHLADFTLLTDFAMLCKSKNLTYTRICRSLMHILLNMTQEYAGLLKANDYSLYARLLGFTAHGKTLLKAIKANASVPVITKPVNALKQLDGPALLSLRSDLFAATVYERTKQQKLTRMSHSTSPAVFQNELTRELIRLP